MESDPAEIKFAKKVKDVRDKRLVTFSRVKRRVLKHVWVIRLLLLGMVLACVATILLVVVLVLNSLGFGRYIKLASVFIFTPRDKIQSIGGRTNILILGKGGVGHEAPDLTDTIMFASVSHEGGGLTLISLPRDIWIDELRAKLNSAYYWGNQKAEGGGEILAKATVESIVGQPIQYVAVIDLSGLSKVVDALGGVSVEVENSFTDERFPIAGREADLCDGDPEFACRYESVIFEKGVQTMDGDKALKFIRSRYAEGDEGTDFARAARQQKVISAIESKLMSREVYFNLQKISSLIKLFEESLETNMSEDVLAIVARRLFDSRGNRNSYVLPEDLLVNPPISPKYDNLYVFVPKELGWEEIWNWVNDVLSTGK